jgi:ABC-type transport system substrate-binding protein
VRGRRAAVLVLSAAAVFAAACSDDDSDGEGDGAAATGGASETTTTAAPAEGTPVVGGTLRMGVSPLESLDPADASPDSASAAIAADLLFDSLTVMPPAAASAQPALASSWETPDGGRTWRFALDPAARFGDGTTITAGDVEYSLERVARRGPTSLAAARLDAVTGYADFVAGTATDLAGIRAADASTVEVALDRPMASLPELLSAPAFGIVSETAVEGVDTFAQTPSVGSGPFRFAERDGDTIVLSRVADGRAYLDHIELHQHDDLGAAYEDFAAGRLDWTLIPPSRVEVAAEDYGADGFVPFQAELFFGFNLADPRFADVRFRQAVAAAIDRQAIVNAVYFGVAAPLQTIIPDGIPGADPARCGPGCTYDPNASLSLLGQAFPAGGIPEVVIDYDDGADEAAVAGIIEQNLEAVGIPASLRPHPPDQFGAFAVSGQQVFARLGWIGAYPVADAYVPPLFTTGSVDNVTGFSDPVVDDLLDRASTEADPAERQTLLGLAEFEILNRAAIVALAQFKLLSVQSDRVQGLELSVAGTFEANAVWLPDG